MQANSRLEREKTAAEREAALSLARSDYESAQVKYQQERDAMTAQQRQERERLLAEREQALRGQSAEHEAAVKARFEKFAIFFNGVFQTNPGFVICLFFVCAASVFCMRRSSN